MSAVAFRRARPEDADAVVEHVYRISPRLADHSFAIGGVDARAVLREDFLRGDGLYGHRITHVVTTEDDVVVGTATAYLGATYRRRVLATARTGLAVLGPVGTAIAVARALETASLFIEPRPDSVFLLNLRLDERVRGRGLAGRFIDHVAVAEARPDTRSIEFDVDEDNTHARARFERLGFRVVAERPYRGSREGLVGFHRMERALVAPPDAPTS